MCYEMEKYIQVQYYVVLCKNLECYFKEFEKFDISYRVNNQECSLLIQYT